MIPQTAMNEIRAGKLASLVSAVSTYNGADVYINIYLYINIYMHTSNQWPFQWQHKQKTKAIQAVPAGRASGNSQTDGGGDKKDKQHTLASAHKETEGGTKEHFFIRARARGGKLSPLQQRARIRLTGRRMEARRDSSAC